MNIKFTKLAVALTATAMFSGCSMFSTKEDELHERLTKQYQQKIEEIENSIDEAPEWFIEQPKSTAQVFYSTGTGRSSNMTMARNKAILDAQTQLADQIGAVVSSQTKQRLVDGYADGLLLNDQVVKKLIAEVSTSGYIVEKIDVGQDRAQYRFYVLLAYPIGESNSLEMHLFKKELQKQSMANNAERFKELDADVAQAKKAN